MEKLKLKRSKRRKTLLRKAYELSPVFLHSFQERIYWFFRSILEVHKRKMLLTFFDFVDRSQWWDERQLKKFQLEKLQKIIKHAYSHVPYYREMFNASGINPSDIKSFNDFRKIPFMTREIIQKKSKYLFARNISPKYVNFSRTSGTTGKPMEVCNLRREVFFDWRRFKIYPYRGMQDIFMKPALVRRGLSYMDCSLKMKRLVMRNNSLVGDFPNAVSFSDSHLQTENCLILSSFKMNEENMFEYVKKINEFQPELVFGYPSSLEILSRFIKKHNLEINKNNKIKAIQTASEILFPNQRKIIEEVFKTKIFDRYGTMENNLRFEECEKHEGYHESMEYGYVEILDKEGNPVTEEGQFGEVVATGFYNYAMPLLRYRTGDIVEYTNKKCSCGRAGLRLKRIIGRAREFFVTKDKTLVPITFHFLSGDNDRRGLIHVERFRFYQDTPGKVILNLVRAPGYNEGDTKQILKTLEKKLNGKIEFKIKFVEELPRSKGKKYIYIEQKLNTKDYHRN